jgi:hypothetical protein
VLSRLTVAIATKTFFSAALGGVGHWKGCSEGGKRGLKEKLSDNWKCLRRVRQFIEGLTPKESLEGGRILVHGFLVLLGALTSE